MYIVKFVGIAVLINRKALDMFGNQICQSVSCDAGIEEGGRC